jgi:hypothetical protein
LLQLQFLDGIKVVSRPRNEICELAYVPRLDLSLLPLELLLLGIDPCLGKAYFFLDLIAAPPNHADIRLEFLLK